MHHSASSIFAYLGDLKKNEPGCKRFYHYRYVEKNKVPQGDKAALGTRCHKIGNEDYLRDGKAPNRAEKFEIITDGTPRIYYPGRIVSNILHHLPPTGSIERVEERLNFTYRGHDLLGYIDHQDDNHVGDLKFTSSLDYAKSEEDLHGDTQRIIYTANRFVESDDKQVDAQWTYGTFDAKHSKKVRLTVLQAPGLAQMDGLVPTLDAMSRLHEVADCMSVEATIAKHTCNAFGSVCPAIDRCKPSARARVVSFGTKIANRIAEVKAMGSPALERLRAARAKAAGATPTPETTVDAVETVAPTNAAAVAADMKAIAAEQARMAGGQINPPGEACEPPPDPKEVKAEAKAAAAEAKAEAKALTAGADAPKRGRGRPPKTSSGDKAPESANDVSASAPHPHTQIGLAVLYVDCFPVKRPTEGEHGQLELVEASELIEAANDIVASELDVPHYSLVEWGKGRGALHVALKHVVAQRAAPFNVLLSTRSSQGMDALQALTEAAFVVVRGAA